MMRLLILFLASSSLALGQPVTNDCNDLFTCTIKTEQALYKIGETPKISVEIKNNSYKSILLVRALDGSEVRWRFPHVYFSIDKIGDSSYRTQRIMRCGNTDNISPKDFIAVEPNAVFDPYQRDSYHRNDFSLSNAANFSTPGKYRITFYYSSDQPNFENWLGRFYRPEPGSNERSLALFSEVPKLDLRSNELVVEFK